MAFVVMALAATASSASATTLGLRSGGTGTATDPKTYKGINGTAAATSIPPFSSYAPPLGSLNGPSTWVSAASSGPWPMATFYEVRFTLPAFTSGSLSLKLRADNWVRVTLNPDTLGAPPFVNHAQLCYSPNYAPSGTPLSFAPSTGLLPGLNVLRFLVLNCGMPSQQNPAALNFAGQVTYTRIDAAPSGLDHFKCYTVKPRPILQRQVTLTDQFGSRVSRVHKARGLCNPVRKKHGNTITPIQFPKAHLTCRRTTDVTGTTAVRSVRLSNQFGVVDTKTTAAQTLCLPSLKRVYVGVPIPPVGANPEIVLDHFRCYGVQPRAVPRTVQLRDQFALTTTKTYELVRLCNPVRKVRNGHVAPIKRPSAHLACYTIKDLSPFHKRKVVVRNQFGLARMRATKVETLCLPTRKYVLAVGPQSQPPPLPASPSFAVRLTASDCGDRNDGVVHTLHGTTDPSRPGSIATAALSGPRVPTDARVTSTVSAEGTFTAQITTPTTAGGYPVTPGTYRWSVSVADPELGVASATIDTDATAREPCARSLRSAGSRG